MEFMSMTKLKKSRLEAIRRLEPVIEAFAKRKSISGTGHGPGYEFDIDLMITKKKRPQIKIYDCSKKDKDGNCVEL